MDRRGRIVGGAAVALPGLALLAAPRVVDAALNRVAQASSPPISDAAARLHRRLEIADLHCDLLLWPRDPLRRSRRGHADLPRLQDGNVAVQVLAAVTRMPARRADLVTPLVALQRWPAGTWVSPRERALHQARRLRRAAARSAGRLVVVTTAGELGAVLAARRAGRKVTGAVLALEGLHALEGELASLDLLHAAGFRMMGLAHFEDNAFAGSTHGATRGGLTELGRRAVRRMEELGIACDLAHASPAAIDDALALATRPLVVSHTGVQATCPGPRNLDDGRLARIAATGGVVGIGFWRGAVGEVSVAAIVRALRHAVEVAGIDHVALGSDFDGAVATPFHAGGLPRLTEALLDAGFVEDELRKIMGGNALRVLRGTTCPSTRDTEPPGVLRCETGDCSQRSVQTV